MREAIDRADRAGFVLDDEAGEAVFDDLRHRAAVVGDDRRTARHRLDHHQPERLRPVDRHQQRNRAAQERRLVGVTDLADVLDIRRIEHRMDLFFVVVAIRPIDLCSNFERNAAMFGNPDRTIDTFLRCDASEKGEVARPYRHRDDQLLGQAVVDGLDPARLRQRPPLRIGDRDDRHGREGVEHRLVFGKIKPAMQRRDERRRLPREQREWIVIEVKVQKIEVIRLAPHLLQHRHVQRVRIADGAVQSQRSRPARFEVLPTCTSRHSPNNVTSCPSATSSSMIQYTTRSVPP